MSSGRRGKGGFMSSAVGEGPGHQGLQGVQTRIEGVIAADGSYI